MGTKPISESPRVDEHVQSRRRVTLEVAGRIWKMPFVKLLDLFGLSISEERDAHTYQENCVPLRDCERW